jgi:hypothetical protein
LIGDGGGDSRIGGVRAVPPPVPADGGGGGPQMLLAAVLLLMPPTGLADRMGEMPTPLSYFHVSEKKGSTELVGELRFS